MEKEFIGVGRRKRAIASVRLRKGKGKIDINGKDLKEYFVTDFQRKTVSSPLEKLQVLDSYDVVVRAKGGGIDGQAVATRLGIARALVCLEEGHRQTLKVAGFLRRDPRKKERKKYGLAGARKQFQFSKR